MLVALNLAIATLTASAGETFSWDSQSHHLALRQGNQVLWQFNFSTNETKPCFHPLAVPAGPVLTSYRPADHPWHRALWFSWKYLNRVNYWEENAKTGFAAGRTTWDKPEIVRQPDYSARISLKLMYGPHNGSPVLNEERVINLSPPGPDGVYFQDWTCAFTALGEDVLLDRTPPPAMQSPGGYAGLSVRLSTAMDAVTATSEQSLINLSEGRYRGKAMALDYSGSLDGRESGIAILDHPANLNSPTPWYVINDKAMHFFTPAVLCDQPHTLKAGEKLTLRYRVLIHPGRWTSARLKSELKRYHAAEAPVESN